MSSELLSGEQHLAKRDDVLFSILAFSHFFLLIKKGEREREPSIPQN
jgi:hypothetical protein